LFLGRFIVRLDVIVGRIPGNCAIPTDRTLIEVGQCVRTGSGMNRHVGMEAR
jgi:hypothetical protein